MWRVAHQHTVYALRVFRPEQVVMCNNELTAMKTARTHNIPVPTVHRQGIWNERPVLLLSWIAGDTIRNRMSRQPWRIYDLGVAFGNLQAQLHTVPEAPNVSPDAWMYWHGLDDPPLQKHLRSITTASPRLLHLDFHPANVMVNKGRVSAVLDWANAQAGDPRADYARTYTILCVEPIPQLPRFIGWLRAGFTRSWQHGYHRAAGTLPDMAAFYVWAGEVMLLDLASRIGKDFSERDFDPLRRWITMWRKRAGL